MRDRWQCAFVGTVPLSQELSRFSNVSVSDLRDEAQRLLVDCSVPEGTAVEAKGELMNRTVPRFDFLVSHPLCCVVLMSAVISHTA